MHTFLLRQRVGTRLLLVSVMWRHVVHFGLVLCTYSSLILMRCDNVPGHKTHNPHLAQLHR
jgi:hypothetical protein